MSKFLFMFPGVGSQCVGMGKYFYDNFNIARETVEEANDVLKIDIADLCFSGSEKEALGKLGNSQLALVTIGVATARVFQQEVKQQANYCIGHSLGEYTALCCAGVLSLHDCLKIVQERGRILSHAASSMGGIMAWVINLDYKIVIDVVEKCFQEGDRIYISAFDSPTQSSISGPKETVIKVGRLLEKEGAIVYPLNLSGPFHSPHMQDSAQQIKRVLQNYRFHDALCPVIANCNAQPYTMEKVVENLSLQLSHPILWQDTLQYLLDQGVDTAVEMGPDKVLKHLLQGNTSQIKPYSMEKEKDLKQLIDTFANAL
jgi:[acyl-carrier-protein] S-malonyltransferase